MTPTSVRECPLGRYGAAVGRRRGGCDARVPSDQSPEPRPSGAFVCSADASRPRPRAPRAAAHEVDERPGRRVRDPLELALCTRRADRCDESGCHARLRRDVRTRDVDQRPERRWAARDIGGPRSMAEHRAGSAGEHGGHLPGVRASNGPSRQTPVCRSVSATRLAQLHRPRRQPARQELSMRYARAARRDSVPRRAGLGLAVSAVSTIRSCSVAVRGRVALAGAGALRAADVAELDAARAAARAGGATSPSRRPCSAAPPAPRRSP